MIQKSKIKNQKSKLHTKIKNFAFCIVILIFAFCILNFNCSAQPISSTELISNTKQYDGKVVVYQGEAIGDVMPRGNFIWLNLLEGKNAIGVWVKREMLPKISSVGGYSRKGDRLEIEGIFNARCLEHGGDLDIHAQKVTVIEKGYAIAEKISLKKIIWARNLSVSAVLLFVCIVIRDVFRRLKKAYKKGERVE